MKIISIGTDRKLFEENSSVRARTLKYSGLVSEYHVIVFSLENLGFKNTNIGNLYIYPTNSKSKFNYISDAVKVGKDIIKKIGKNDVVLTTQDPFETGWVGRKLKKEFNLPLQIQVHTDFLNHNFRKNILNFVRVTMTSFTVPLANSVRVVSGNIKESLVKKFNISQSKVDVLPIYVDIKKYREAFIRFDLKREYPQFKKIILMASRLTKEKKIDVAIYAFKKLQDDFQNIGLVIAGDGPERKNLEYLSNKLGLKHKVIFIGWQNDLPSLYKSSDMFWLTSDYEGYGMTLVEAGASGVPIISTKVGLAGTQLFRNGENSFVVNTGDYMKIAHSTRELLTDSEKAELFKKGMQDTISKIYLSEDDYSREYIGLLKKCLEK